MARMSLKFIYLLVFAFMMTPWASPASAAQVSIPPMAGKPGQVLDIPVMIDQVDNLAGVKLVIRYEKQILVYRKGVKTKYTGSLMHIINDKKPGLLIAVMAGARGIQGKDFPILVFTFQIARDLKERLETRLEIQEVQLMSDKLKDIAYQIKVSPLTITP